MCNRSTRRFEQMETRYRKEREKPVVFSRLCAMLLFLSSLVGPNFSRFRVLFSIAFESGYCHWYTSEERASETELGIAREPDNVWSRGIRGSIFLLRLSRSGQRTHTQTEKSVRIGCVTKSTKKNRHARVLPSQCRRGKKRANQREISVRKLREFVQWIFSETRKTRIKVSY